MAEMRRPSMFPALVLALAVAGLGYVNIVLMSFDVDTTPIAPSPASGKINAPDSKDLQLALPARLIEEFPQTASRPIFFADRRMPEKPKPKPVIVAAAKEVAQPPAPPPEPLQLDGIMDEGEGRKVLVRTAADPQGTWLSLGDEYRGWQLVQVTADNAIVEARGQRAELRLYTTSAGKTVKR